MDDEAFWGEPVELYLFETGDSTYYAYTDGERAITLGGKTYEPIPIERGRITSSAGLDKTQMKVTVPLSAQIAEIFRTYPPGFKVSLKVFAGHVNDHDQKFNAVWVGRVLQCSRENTSGGVERAVLSCEPASTTMRQSGLRRNWQLSCPHVLYGALCGASEAVATTSHTVVDMGGTWIELAPDWEGPIPRNKFRAGKVKWDGDFGKEQRMILGTEGAVTLQLAGPTSALNIGDTVEVALGCNRLRGDCTDLHDNIVNFGGQPWIPTENPINKSQI